MADIRQLEKDQEFIDGFAKQIRDACLFDSVAIIVTKYCAAENETHTMTSIRGNYFAANSSIRDVLIRDEERTRIQVQAEGDDE